MLVHSDAHYSLTTDASDLAIGALLQQQVEGRLEPIAFYSRKNTPKQQRYSI